MRQIGQISSFPVFFYIVGVVLDAISNPRCRLHLSINTAHHAIEYLNLQKACCHCLAPILHIFGPHAWCGPSAVVKLLLPCAYPVATEPHTFLTLTQKTSHFHFNSTSICTATLTKPPRRKARHVLYYALDFSEWTLAQNLPIGSYLRNLWNSSH